MANTTNFGWETPDDMRTLGSAIDTSFVDLKGGTTGQNLRKATNTDLDFTWAGDATNTVIDAEGDLLVGDAADTLQRLAIGTTGQVLTVDTAIDGKIKWAAAASSAFVGCRAAKNASQSINDSTFTAASFQVEDYDTDSFHDNSTNNSRMTIPSGKGGYYLLVADISFASSGAGTRKIAFRVNGSDYRTEMGIQASAGGTSTEVVLSDIQNLSAGDYIEVMAWQNSGGALNINYDGNNIGWFALAKIG
jgi:hypothetical protein